MKITGTPSPEVLATNTKNVREPAAAEAVSSAIAKKADSSVSAQPRDSVEISAAGRAMAGTGSLPAERVNDVRQRILSGAYNANEVIDTVARRILQRGDI